MSSPFYLLASPPEMSFVQYCPLRTYVFSNLLLHLGLLPSGFRPVFSVGFFCDNFMFALSMPMGPFLFSCFLCSFFRLSPFLQTEGLEVILRSLIVAMLAFNNDFSMYRWFKVHSILTALVWFYLHFFICVYVIFQTLWTYYDFDNHLYTRVNCTLLFSMWFCNFLQ